MICLDEPTIMHETWMKNFSIGLIHETLCDLLFASPLFKQDFAFSAVLAGIAYPSADNATSAAAIGP
jgi:hypothetical protein